MVTRNQFSTLEMRKASPYFSALKTIVETAFYENQVISIKTLREAYQLASNAAGTVISGHACHSHKRTWLPSYARVLLTNSGAVVGRTAKARRIYGLDSDEMSACYPLCEVRFIKPIVANSIKQMLLLVWMKSLWYVQHLMVPEEEIKQSLFMVAYFQI